jgi:hypothetical protein
MKSYFEFEVDVDYDYHPGYLGSRVEPPEPASIELLSVTLYGADILHVLPQDVLDVLEVQCFEDVQAAHEYALEAAAEAELERRRESYGLY